MACLLGLGTMIAAGRTAPSMPTIPMYCVTASSRPVDDVLSLQFIASCRRALICVMLLVSSVFGVVAPEDPNLIVDTLPGRLSTCSFVVFSFFQARKCYSV